MTIAVSGLKHMNCSIEVLTDGFSQLLYRTVEDQTVGVVSRLSEFNLTDQANMPLFDHTADAPNRVLAQMMRLSFPAPQGLDGNIPSPK